MYHFDVVLMVVVFSQKQQQEVSTVRKWREKKHRTRVTDPGVERLFSEVSHDFSCSLERMGWRVLSADRRWACVSKRLSQPCLSLILLQLTLHIAPIQIVSALRMAPVTLAGYPPTAFATWSWWRCKLTWYLDLAPCILPLSWQVTNYRTPDIILYFERMNF